METKKFKKINLQKYIPDQEKEIQKLFELARVKNDKNSMKILTETNNELQKIKEEYDQHYNNGYMDREVYNILLKKARNTIGLVATNDLFRNLYIKTSKEKTLMEEQYKEKIKLNNEVYEKKLENANNHIQNLSQQLDTLSLTNIDKELFEKEKQKYINQLNKFDEENKNLKKALQNKHNEENEELNDEYQSIISGNVSEQWVEVFEEFVKNSPKDIVEETLPKTRDDKYYIANKKNVKKMRDALGVKGKPQLKNDNQVLIPVH